MKTNTFVVATKDDMLDLPAITGDICICIHKDGNEIFVLNGTNPANYDDWEYLKEHFNHLYERRCYRDISIKEQLKLYIEFLYKILPTYHDYEEWIPICIECLEFALCNVELLTEKPELYRDTLSTLHLLYSWIVDNRAWAYIELRQKFRKIYSPKEVGTALKELANRLSNQNKNNEYLVSFKDINGNFKSIEQVLSELSEQWNNL
jgi:hypothetical protein